MEPNKEQLWHEVLESLKVTVSVPNYKAWLSQTHLTELEEKDDRATLTIGCVSSFVKQTLETRYFGLIQETLEKTLSKKCDISFTVKQNTIAVSTTDIEKGSPLFEESVRPAKDIRELLIRARIRPGFNFENFAVSSSNQMAYAASEAVAKSPGNAYNPLFIWGGVGVGKTHLMVSVGVDLLENDAEAKVLFCTGEEFTNEIVQGIRNKNMQAVRDRYRKLAALFVDDIQFIAGKDTVQEEFFHTFNAVTGAGGQVILTSDRPPSEIAKLEARLRSRFEAGLIVDVSPPDFELRCAILGIKARERGIELPDDLIQLIAGNVESARELEGFLLKLTSTAKLKSVEISPELISSLLGKGQEETTLTKIRATPNDMIGAVSRYYSVGKRALLSDSRQKQFAFPRQVLMYLLKTQLSLPYQEVGRLIGGRDHTTVMHAVDKITKLASMDVNTRQDILGIKNYL